MQVEFTGKLWFWDGPAAWCFVTVPAELSAELKSIAGSVTPGWGMIPVTVQIGETTWDTSLYPGKEGYDLPVKAAVRKKESLKEGDEVTVRLAVRQ